MEAVLDLGKKITLKENLNDKRAIPCSRII